MHHHHRHQHYNYYCQRHSYYHQGHPLDHLYHPHRGNLCKINLSTRNSSQICFASDVVVLHA
uniref:Uncharacterized protein n=1 Tax=Octopus bimaculoides TaxID=37653 RepID=A0A0L8I1A7_OCTBM